MVVFGRWALVVGCWLLVVGCWLLVVGRSSLVLDAVCGAGTPACASPEATISFANPIPSALRAARRQECLRHTFGVTPSCLITKN
jgi:hypothetical protein